MDQRGMETTALYHRLRSALESNDVDPCIVYEEALLSGWRDLSELALRRLSVDMIKITAQYHHRYKRPRSVSSPISSAGSVSTPSSPPSAPSPHPARLRPASKFSSSSSLSSAAPPEWAALLQQPFSKFSSTTLNSASTTDSRQHRWSKQSTVSSPSTPTSRSRSDSTSPRLANSEAPWSKPVISKSNALALHPNRKSKIVDAELLELDDLATDSDGLYDFLSFPPPVSPSRTSRRPLSMRRASLIPSPQLPPSPPARTIPLRPLSTSASPTRSPPPTGATLSPTKGTRRSISPALESIAERETTKPTRSPPKIPLSIVIPDAHSPVDQRRKSTPSPTIPPIRAPAKKQMASGGDIGFFSLMRGLARV